MKAFLMEAFKPTRPRYYPAHTTKGGVRIQGLLPGQRKRVTSRRAANKPSEGVEPKAA